MQLAFAKIDVERVFAALKLQQRCHLRCCLREAVVELGIEIEMLRVYVAVHVEGGIKQHEILACDAVINMVGEVSSVVVETMVLHGKGQFDVNARIQFLLNTVKRKCQPCANGMVGGVLPHVEGILHIHCVQTEIYL